MEFEPSSHLTRRQNRMVRPARHGALLLVVLGLLVLFLLAGMTFIMVAGQFRKASQAQIRQDRYPATRPALLANSTMMKLVRGESPGAAGPLAVHSVLEDLYGRDAYRGQIAISGIRTGMNGHFVAIRPTAPPPVNDHYFAGCVMTMLDGPAAGTSSRIVAFEAGVFAVESFAGVTPQDGNQFLVNGRPLNGTGGALGAHSSGIEWCLLPGHPDYAANIETGGLDEGYDAADFSNQFLAWKRPEPAGGEDIIPSFHRPSAVHYIRHYFDDLGISIPHEVFSSMTLRPTWIAHPHFSGSNPYLDPGAGTDPAVLLQRLITGTITGVADGSSAWDIDNDGDGLADSVWIDAGLPVQTMPDGRRAKPLVAILCVDLDGRVNLNTAGIFGGLQRPDISALGPWAVGGVIDGSRLPLGMGYGAAEIDLTPLLQPSTATTTIIQLFAERYRSPTAPAESLPGRPNVADNAQHLISLGLPPMKDMLPGLHTSPADYFGRSVAFLDHFGWPRFPGGQVVLQPDQPYELNVVDESSFDQRFTESDLEPVLRRYDVDVSNLSSRLTAGGAASIVAGLQSPHTITSRSYSLPVARVPVGVYEELRAPQPTVMLPFEFRHGMRMNLNRLFGNTIDDNNNGITDEPGEELALRDWLVQLVNDDPLFTPILADVTQNPANIPAASRQLYARHLYCLMMLARNPAVDIDDNGTVVPATIGSNGQPIPNPTTARAIAQWAINVVDFMDSDAIMTPFEYDINLTNGWNVDGNLTTDEGPERGVVWGCERPELLITETLAWHDRRTEDRDDESIAADGSPMDPEDSATIGMGDTDLDQHALPRGALYCELYNPNGRFDATTSQLVTHPVEFYAATPGGNALELSRLTPPDGPGGPQSAVWRMRITNDPRDPDVNPPTAQAPPYPIDTRIVYFVTESDYTNPSFVRPPSSPGERDYYNDIHNRPIMILPGQYAVVGSPGINLKEAGLSTGDTYVSTVGLLSSENLANASATNPPNLSYNETRRVELRPQQGGMEARVVGNGSTGESATPIPRQLDMNEAQPNVAIVINRPRPLTMSEPPGGYPTSVGTATLSGSRTEPFYSKVLDQPVDVDASGVDRFRSDSVELAGTGIGLEPPLASNNNEAQEEGVIPKFRVVYLQRLANPLVPWDPLTNPYRTVDRAEIDLAVFNGLGETQYTPRVDLALYAKQRGDNTGRVPRNLWTQEEPTSPGQYEVIAAADPRVVESPEPHHVDFLLRTSLGHLNSNYQPAINAVNAPHPWFVGAPDTRLVPGTFPWLTWLNRPFANPMELMVVPRSSSSKLLQTYRIPGFTTTNNPHGYVLDFVTHGGVDPQFYRIFEYVEVPDRFAGTEHWYAPAAYSAAPSNERPPAFHPPNNRMSRFRDPGRINVNTISDVRVWQALSATLGGTIEDWYQQIEPSRRGYLPDGYTNIPGQPPRYDNLHLNRAVPTQFANPFRSAYAAGNSPFGYLNLTNEVDATLLRRSVDLATGQFGNAPLFDSPLTAPYYDIQRNPMFRYQAYQKLCQSTTSHSNVFCVWLTIGYFELQPWYDLDGDGVFDEDDAPPGTPPTVDRFHPDGMMLGREFGMEVGEIQRHRAFYIIDRSIPVAFQPGQDFNARNAIVLQRLIE